MSIIATPANVRRADELLPAARRLIDADSNRFIDDPTIEVSCRAGCSACCSQPVPVTPAEVRAALGAIERLDPDLQSRVWARVERNDAALAAAGVDESTFGNAGSDRAARDHAVMQYFRLDLPCPLLEDGVCSIRDDRPLACREYLVTSDPSLCSPAEQGIAGRRADHVVRIRSKTDVIRGFYEISGEFGEDRQSILCFALARPPEDTVPGEPRSGPQLAQRLTQRRAE